LINPAFFQGPAASYIYYSGIKSEGNGGGDYLKAYTITNGVVSSAPVAQTSNVFPIGSTPSISANGTQNGLLWAIERKDLLSSSPGNQTATLYAYPATNVARTAYSSAQTKQDNAVRDQMGCGNKFQTPTVANGKVYVGTENELDVFGLLANKPSAPLPSVSVPCFTFTGQAVGTTSAAQSTVLTNLGPGALTISGFSFQGLNPGEFSQTNTCGASIAVGASCKINITFTPTIATIPQQAYLQISDNAVGGALTLEVIGVGK
jgi:hypothetical protein